MKKILLFISFIIPAVFFMQSCSEAPLEITSENEGVLIYSRNGLIDSLTGTCSSFLTRTAIIDTLDFTKYRSVKIEFDAYTDGDLSRINIFYLNQNAAVNIMNIEGINAISNNKSIIVNSPNIKSYFYLRMQLFASVCTGDLYHLKLRDLKISGIE